MQIIILLIRLVHLLLVICLLISIFINNCFIKNLALVFLIFLIFQYILGYGKCGLTELEYWILGEKKYKQGFLYRLIHPLIKIPENYFDNGLFVLHLVWIAVLVCQIYRGCMI